MNHNLRNEIKSELLGIFATASDDVQIIAEKLDEIYDGQQERPYIDVIDYVEKQKRYYDEHESEGEDSNLKVKDELALYLTDLITDLNKVTINPESVLTKISEVFGEESTRTLVEKTHEYKAYILGTPEGSEPALC